MKKILFILLTLAIPTILLAEEPVREWTSKDGKKSQAAFDTSRDTNSAIVPLIKNGKKFKVQFNNLSKADQDYVTRVRHGRRNIKDDSESRAIQVVPTSQRYALLIGVNEYPEENLLKTLPSAVKDMKDLADALEKYAGFPRENVTLMTDESPTRLLPTRANIREQIAKIRNKLSQNDLLIVAFSGHGVTIDYSDGSEARPYFCVRDTDLPDIDTLLSRNWVFEQVDKCKADRKIFFCDACRTLYTTDKLIQIASRAGQSASIRSLQDPSETWGYNYVLMSSCAKGQNSIDMGTNGLFTSYLLEGLRTSAAALRDGDLTAFSWFDYAAKKTEITSRRMIKENPELVIGAEKQTQQTPRIECRGEMSRFVIAKLDLAGPIVVPREVEKVEVREYQVGSLRVRLHSSGSTLSDEKIQAGKIQLPPIPDKIDELTGVVQGINDALSKMENGTHEALRDARQAKIDSQAQYEAIKLRRDEEWKKLSPEVQNNLEERIKASVNANPTAFDELQPKDVRYSQFLKLVLWGQKTELARLENLRVENAITDEIQKKINQIKAVRADKDHELQKETEKFRKSVVQFILEQTPGWKKKNENEKLDYMFLTDTIPALLKYPFDWNEKSLIKLAEDIWKTKRPCVIEREQTERENAWKCLSIPGMIAGEKKAVSVNGVEFVFRWCPAGTFMMGSPTSEIGRYDDEEKQHKVKLTKGFWLLETEVTVGMFKAFVTDSEYVPAGNAPYGYEGGEWKQNSQLSWCNPGFSQDDNHPVTCVSWDDAVAFCKWLSKKTGQNIYLPTESQWEYACRAGTTEAYAGNLDAMAWYNSNNETHPVGSKKSNAWGLYDMHGNVWEWCADYWNDEYPGGSVTDPVGPSAGPFRVYRGGCWCNNAHYCRSASRSGYVPDGRIIYLGFRISRSITNSDN